jgi:23S rRNA U2552 (ribose-2'-O)-methylase RlmE/FtsJ
MDKNILILYQLPKNNENNILEYDQSPLFSIFPNMPLFKYGFHHYIHQTKDKMEIFEVKDEKTKSREVHKIINPYEDTVPQEDITRQFKNDKIKPSDDINTFSIKYFSSDRIISRAFYKMWELLMMFPLLPDQSKNITTVHLAEAPGSFVQSIIYYRNKFFPKEYTDKDIYIATSIDSDKKSSEYVPSFNTNLTSIKNFKQWSYKNSDLTQCPIIDKFILDHKNTKADLITADGGFNWKDENYQEQEAYLLLLSEIYCALKIQKKGGCFVIKFFEIFTELTVKMIEILKRFYSNVIITKPLLSRLSNSEKYIICINFQDNLDTYIDKIYEIIRISNKNTDKYLVDIFPNYQINPALDIMIKLSSTQLSNEQHKQINEMITYYNDGNYYGEVYRKYLNLRRKANDDWISLFFPLNNKELVSTRQMINKLMIKNIEELKKTLEELNKKIYITYIDINNSVRSTELTKSDNLIEQTGQTIPTKPTKPTKQTKSTKLTKSAKRE